MYPPIALHGSATGAAIDVRADLISNYLETPSGTVVEGTCGTLWRVGETVEEVRSLILNAIHWKEERPLVAQAQIVQHLANKQATGIAVPGRINGGRG